MELGKDSLEICIACKLFLRVEYSIFQTAWATLHASTVQQVQEEA